MRSFDLSPLFRSSVGFDHLASLLDSVSRGDKNSYPPYNIELVDEDSYRITMAVAGFKQSDIEITAERNHLSVVGHQQSDEDRNYLHRGIAARNFERQFQLADHVKVVNASMQDGLLHIELQREIPEAMKPRRISIESADQDKLVEAESEKVA